LIFIGLNNRKENMKHPKLLYPFVVNSNWSKTRVIESYSQFSYTDSGKDILDLSLGNAGCFMLGFNRKDIIDYVSEQMLKNPFVSGEYMTTNEAVLNLSEKLFDLSNGYKSLFTLSGSDAVESAIKLATMYNPDRQKIIGFQSSYHGSTFLVSSIGSIPEMTQHWGKHINCCVLPSFDIELIRKEISDANCIVIESCSWNNGLDSCLMNFGKNLELYVQKIM
jgi:adenosylmethionine-8-amino-7-oxononanoate aminotransferase